MDNHDHSHIKTCIVAIARDEEKFLDEWLVYHKMIGADYFFLYDDDPLFPLEAFVRPHLPYVKVINWHGQDKMMSGRMNQTKAYQHAVDNFIKQFDWVAFIDIDEFIVLRSHENLKDFLKDFDAYSSVSLNWHLFGHNGYYDDPDGLITSSLTRRMYSPNKNVKSITRPSAIEKIDSPHSCKLKYGERVDVNKRTYSKELYPDKTAHAHINHYQCRSFLNWMNRATRGDVNFDKHNCPDEHKWRLTEESCLRQFVCTVAVNKNEYVDNYMVKYKDTIEKLMAALVR